MEGDFSYFFAHSSETISIHSLRMEGDSAGSMRYERMGFQSTPSAWRETPAFLLFALWIRISIHSLRMEGDLFHAAPDNQPTHFNPLPPHGGRQSLISSNSMSHFSFQSTPSAWRETQNREKKPRKIIFQSTPSAWRETSPVAILYTPFRNFNPLPPHGGRHNIVNKIKEIPGISIHSLRMEGDVSNLMAMGTSTEFQSTPSAWRET